MGHWEDAVTLAISDGPLILQSDRTILLDLDHPRAAEARDELAAFAEIERGPDHVHTYRVTPLSIWNAAAAGHTATGVLATLTRLGRHEPSSALARFLRDQFSRYGRLRLVTREGALALEADAGCPLDDLVRQPAVAECVARRLDEGLLEVRPESRGALKQALIALGWPVEDLAGYAPGAPLAVAPRPATAGGRPFALRDYQRGAVDAFWAGGAQRGGSGVVVLPCGAGKTIVGIGAMAAARARTLVLCYGTAAARQWIAELLDKTTLTPDEVGEYSGDAKAVRPVTVATYQTLTYRARPRDGRSPGEADHPHLRLLTRHDWGLVIYDEAHLLPAPVFRLAASLQARRRLGLTATLVREDGRERDVFALIGPRRFDLPWRALERQGWIAPAECHEARVDLPPDARRAYVAASARERHRIAAENPAKLDALVRLLRRHAGDRVLIIGQYLDQLGAIAAITGAPLVTGRTPSRERDRRFEEFRRGHLACLIVSKVANLAVDLPVANVAIQVSGAFGSRQEEAQRLGRVLRPKPDGGRAHFYTIVTRDTGDQDFAARRQLFLTEQGYRYTILDAADLDGLDAPGGLE